MTTYNAIKLTNNFKVAFLKTITLSGTIKKADVGVSRKLLIYKNDYTEPTIEMESESDGTFTVDVAGGSNDEFRVVAIGLTGENSDIYEHIVEG